MSYVTCQTCGCIWDASRVPTCPKCQSSAWRAEPGLFRTKHKPDSIGTNYPSFRSILTEDVVSNPQDFFDYAAASGTWYWSTKHNSYCHVTDTPLGEVPGSGIPRNHPNPTLPMSGLTIAKAVDDPHAFAHDPADIPNLVSNGTYLPLPKCSEPGCSNLAMPGRNKCILH